MTDAKARFLASFPPIQSAIKRSGGGNGMRIQLDIPESEMHKAMPLMDWTETVVMVTIEPQKRETQDDGQWRTA